MSLLWLEWLSDDGLYSAGRPLRGSSASSWRSVRPGLGTGAGLGPVCDTARVAAVGSFLTIGAARLASDVISEPGGAMHSIAIRSLPTRTRSVLLSVAGVLLPDSGCWVTRTSRLWSPRPGTGAAVTV